MARIWGTVKHFGLPFFSGHQQRFGIRKKRKHWTVTRYHFQSAQLRYGPNSTAVRHHFCACEWLLARISGECQTTRQAEKCSNKRKSKSSNKLKSLKTRKVKNYSETRRVKKSNYRKRWNKRETNTITIAECENSASSVNHH